RSRPSDPAWEWDPEVSLSQFGRHVTMPAHGFAAETFKPRTPGVSEDDAWRYAARFWKAHVDTILNFLALSEAVAESEVCPPCRSRRYNDHSEPQRLTKEIGQDHGRNRVTSTPAPAPGLGE